MPDFSEADRGQSGSEQNVVRYCVLCARETEHEDAHNGKAWRCCACQVTITDRTVEDQRLAAALEAPDAPDA